MAEITYNVKVQAGVAGAKPTKQPSVGDKIKFTAPEGTFLEFEKKGFPFEGAIPAKPVDAKTATFTLTENKTDYHVICGHYVGKQYTRWMGGFDVPGRA